MNRVTTLRTGYRETRGSNCLTLAQNSKTSWMKVFVCQPPMTNTYIFCWTYYVEHAKEN